MTKSTNYSAPREKRNGPRLAQEVVRLADDAARLVIEADIKLLVQAGYSPKQWKKLKLGRRPSKLEVHRAKERVSRMTRGRVPTRIAVAGDEGGAPVPFAYVEVGKSGGKK